MLDITKIIQEKLPAANYYQEEIQKKQIFIHHTAGGSNAKNVIGGWKTRTDHVSTAFVIAGKPSSATSGYKDGDIYQAFSSKYWGYHLGLKKEVFAEQGVPYLPLDKSSIAIEICNWGALTKAADGTFKQYLGGAVPAAEAVTLNPAYKGSAAYHAYTDAQLASLKDLLVYLCGKYSIPKTFNAEMFDISKKALTGTPGIWTHTSVRKDKVDCSPQPKLLDVLKSL
ncbi:MAG: N-acetylmuramoyl-L-alanine amidase [Bacteroidota bacterium]|nr:N-acetylmuramoyl-L-alanine amidase [Bacteroidota bacterium]